MGIRELRSHPLLWHVRGPAALTHERNARCCFLYSHCTCSKTENESRPSALLQSETLPSLPWVRLPSRLLCRQHEQQEERGERIPSPPQGFLWGGARATRGEDGAKQQVEEEPVARSATRGKGGFSAALLNRPTSGAVCPGAVLKEAQFPTRLAVGATNKLNSPTQARGKENRLV